MGLVKWAIVGLGSVNALLACVFLSSMYAPRQKNVVIMSVCSLRADSLRALGRGGQAPNLDRLAGSGVLFRHAYAQSFWTRPGHQVLFTGRYPEPTNRGMNDIPRDDVTLAESLKANGWQTAAFTGGGEMSAQGGLDRGFDEYVAPVHSTCSTNTGEALEWLDRRPDAKRPFFLFVQGFDTHRPNPDVPCPTPSSDDPGVAFAHTHIASLDVYARILDGMLYTSPLGRDGRPLLVAEQMRADPQKYHAVQIPMSARAHVRSHYDAAVQRVDEAVGLLVQGLEKRDLTKDTLLVVLSDHGWELFERGGCTHSKHGFDGIAHVPLVMAGGGFPSGLQVDEEAGLVDVAPTILEYLGLPPQARHQGRSLVSLVRGKPDDATRYALSCGVGGVTNLHLRSRGIELVVRSQGRRYELYDLRSDPAETRDLSNDAASQEALAQMVAMHDQLLPLLAGSLPQRLGSLPSPSLPAR